MRALRHVNVDEAKSWFVFRYTCPVAEYILPIFYGTLQIFFLAGVGFVLRYFAKWESVFFHRLSTFAVRVTLPVLFFARLSQTDLSALADGLLFVGVSVLVAALGVLIGLLASAASGAKKEGYRRQTVALSAFGNSGYMPITVTEIFAGTLPGFASVFGREEPALLIGAYLIAFSPLLWSVGNYIMTGKGSKLRLRTFVSPPFIGIVAGILVPLLGLQEAFADPRLPFATVVDVAERLGGVTSALVMIVVGSMIAELGHPRHVRRPIKVMAAVVSVARFFVLPGLFWLIYALFLRHIDLAPPVLWVLFLETHVPPATNLAIMARDKDVGRDEAAYVLFVTYLIYLALLPLFMMLYLGVTGIRF